MKSDWIRVALIQHTAILTEKNKKHRHRYASEVDMMTEVKTGAEECPASPSSS